MSPENAKKLAAARERNKTLDPGMNDPALTSQAFINEQILDVLESTGESRFTARVLQGGMVVIPKDVRAVKSVTAGKYVTLDLLMVTEPEAPA